MNSVLFPQQLIEIKDFLQQQNLLLSQTTRDGRVNSAFNEDEIVALIDQHFAIRRPKICDWFDFAFENDGIFYPVNIKVSTTETADNLNCKLGIYYALTGKIPDFKNGIAWDKYFKKLKENICENNQDYYFLIVNKENTTDIFLSSLKTITQLVPNGNNLPFQACWNDNRNPINRNYQQAQKFILSIFGQSLKLRANAYLSFKEYFAEYV